VPCIWIPGTEESGKAVAITSTPERNVVLRAWARLDVCSSAGRPGDPAPSSCQVKSIISESSSGVLCGFLNNFLSSEIVVEDSNDISEHGLQECNLRSGSPERKV
jgi:hypothetical protein